MPPAVHNLIDPYVEGMLTYTLIIVAIGVVLLILLITLFKMNTFVSLIITSFLVAIMLKLPVMSLPKLIEKGLGGLFATITIVFCFGAMLGKLLSDSGNGYRIANTLI